MIEKHCLFDSNNTLNETKKVFDVLKEEHRNKLTSNITLFEKFNEQTFYQLLYIWYCCKISDCEYPQLQMLLMLNSEDRFEWHPQSTLPDKDKCKYSVFAKLDKSLVQEFIEKQKRFKLKFRPHKEDEECIDKKKSKSPYDMLFARMEKSKPKTANTVTSGTSSTILVETINTKRIIKPSSIIGHLKRNWLPYTLGSLIISIICLIVSFNLPLLHSNSVPEHPSNKSVTKLVEALDEEPLEDFYIKIIIIIVVFVVFAVIIFFFAFVYIDKKRSPHKSTKTGKTVKTTKSMQLATSIKSTNKPIKRLKSSLFAEWLKPKTSQLANFDSLITF